MGNHRRGSISIGKKFPLLFLKFNLKHFMKTRFGLAFISDVLLSTAQADHLLLSLGRQIETFVTFHLSRNPNVTHY